MKQHFVAAGIPPLNAPFTFLPSPLPPGTELQNLSGIQNETLGYLRARRLSLRKLSNWKASSMKAYRNLLAPLSPFLVFQQVAASSGSKHKSWPGSRNLASADRCFANTGQQTNRGELTPLTRCSLGCKVSWLGPALRKTKNFKKRSLFSAHRKLKKEDLPHKNSSSQGYFQWHLTPGWRPRVPNKPT